jgi:hypothetical protein
MISNAARQAATSLEAATRAIDAALETCGSGMRGLEERGKTHLPAFKKLQVISTHSRAIFCMSRGRILY